MIASQFKKWLGVLLLGTLFIGCSQTVGGNDSSSNLSELEYNYGLLNYFYVYNSEIQPLANYEGQGSGEPYGDVLAMYASLSDPFTRYFTPTQASAVYDYLSTSGGGALIGIEMNVLVDSLGPDTIVVKRVYPGSPAESAGIMSGDRIVSINGTQVTGENVLDTYQTLAAGGAGTVVNLGMRRGTTDLTASVTKVEMALPTVFVDSLDGIPVIQITQYTETTIDTAGTQSEFRTALRQIAGAKAAVIDLRGNPGGSVDHCLAMSDELVPSGVLIREVQHYYDDTLHRAVIDTSAAMATAGGLGESIQWVFLADSGSASCSEIMLSAAKTRLGSYVIGDTSYGKGIGQYYMWTQAKGLAGITAIQFFDQDWYTYHKIGIIPDERITDPDSALARAVVIAQQKASALTKRTATPPTLAAARTLGQALAVRRQDSQTAEGGAWRFK